LAGQRRQADEAAARATADLAALETERRQLESEGEALQTSRRELAKERAELESAHAALESQRGAHEEAATELAIERDRCDLLRTSLATDQDELQSLRRSLEAQRESLDAERSALETDRELVTKIESKALAQSRELENAKNALDAERTALDETRTKIERERAELDRERDQIERERAQLEAAREVLQAEQDELIAAQESVAMQQRVAEESLAAQRQALAARQGQVEPDKRKTELQKVQGIWKLVCVEANGREVPHAVINRPTFVWVIKGNKITHRPEIGFKRESTFELDLTKTPNEIAVRPLNGRPKRGIYSLENDCLKVCVNKDKDQLPTEFSTKAGDGLRILVFNRQMR
jgi:uncharacterized protein (TIGR03067 family)